MVVCTSLSDLHLRRLLLEKRSRNYAPEKSFHGRFFISCRDSGLTVVDSLPTFAPTFLVYEETIGLSPRAGDHYELSAVHAPPANVTIFKEPQHGDHLIGRESCHFAHVETGESLDAARCTSRPTLPIAMRDALFASSRDTLVGFYREHHRATADVAIHTLPPSSSTA